MTGPDRAPQFSLIPSEDLARTGEVSSLSGRERDLLCALSYVHLACGQSAQSVALLRLVADDNPHDIGLLRILAYGLIAEGNGNEALSILDRLDDLDNQPGARLPLTLMRSHALRRAGRIDEARAAFQSYVALRTSAASVKPSKGFP